jgi:hypothetical protein
MSAAEGPGRLYRLLALTGILGAFGVAVLLGNRSARPEIIGGAATFVIAVLVVVVWDRLPERTRPGARFARGHLMTAAFTAICLGGSTFVPAIVQHKTSMQTWIVLPIILAAVFAGIATAERHEDDKIDQDLAAWRRMRPHARPKAR